MARPYDRITATVAAGGLREERMRAVVDALWGELQDKGVSWIGFYLVQPEAPQDERLVLGPCRDKPACSPIGLHGVCGQALISRRTRIVADVSTLGDDYIACDPRDRSEIVIPMIDEAGACWGVLDVDSWEVASFDQDDERGLRAVISAVGLF